MKFNLLLTLILLLIRTFVVAQYPDAQRVLSRLNELKKNKLVSVSSIARTYGGRDIFAVTIGKGDTENKPGIAVIGGVNGTQISSTEIVLQMLEKMSAMNPSILNEVTFYFFPDMSPDASSQYFADLKYGRERNARPYDDDSDGRTDEDGYDDLNSDGLITWMRITDTLKGDWIVHPDNPAVMIKADRAGEERGRFIVIREGIDNDKDRLMNEDPPGGVIFNRNFTFNYPYFGQGAGENAISEEETRALAGFLFDHWNIFAVLMIGPENNLSGVSELKADLIDKKIPSSVNETDKKYFDSVVKLYERTVKLNDPYPVNPSGGDLLSWTYYHYNRFGFSTPGWNPGYDDNNKGSTEYSYLKWASEKNINSTVPWQVVEHPDYPGKVVEVGGIRPFMENNPPVEAVDSVSRNHLDFLISLAERHPSLAFGEVMVMNEKNIYTVEAEIINKGGFPTSVHLTNSKWIKKVRFEIEPGKGQEVSGGRNVFLYDRIDPGESKKAIWLVKGKGRITLFAGSPQSGFIVKNIDLN